jgi:protein-S-isoprenylcysteine O-methyltransferase Ste14
MYLAIAGRKLLSVADAAQALSGSSHLVGDIVLISHLISSAIFFLVIGLITPVRKQPVLRERRLRGWVLPITVTILMSLIGWLDTPLRSTPVMLIALFFVAGGTVFTLYSLRHLGRHFGVVSDARGLVTSGPYRWVRHPLYAGELLTTIGLLIGVFSPLTATAFAVGLGLQIWRAKVEEQSLTRAFPEYEAYAARTPMLIPFVRLPLPRPSALANAAD